MSNLSSFVKRIRDIMWNDAGVNGDAQRIEQMAWILFLKVYDAKETDWNLMMKNINLLFLIIVVGQTGRLMTVPVML